LKKAFVPFSATAFYGMEIVKTRNRKFAKVRLLLKLLHRITITPTFEKFDLPFSATAFSGVNMAKKTRVKGNRPAIIKTCLNTQHQKHVKKRTVCLSKKNLYV